LGSDIGGNGPRQQAKGKGLQIQGKKTVGLTRIIEIGERDVGPFGRWKQFEKKEREAVGHIKTIRGGERPGLRTEKDAFP